MNRSDSLSDILLPTCSPNRQAAAMPALVIVDQQSLHKESFTKDGEQVRFFCLIVDKKTRKVASFLQAFPLFLLSRKLPTTS